MSHAGAEMRGVVGAASVEAFSLYCACVAVRQRCPSAPSTLECCSCSTCEISAHHCLAHVCHSNWKNCRGQSVKKEVEGESERG